MNLRTRIGIFILISLLVSKNKIISILQMNFANIIFIGAFLLVAIIWGASYWFTSPEMTQIRSYKKLNEINENLKKMNKR
jgi:hypothetical protein